MPDCEMCGNNSDKYYTVNLTITSDFDKNEHPLKETVLFVQNVKIK